MRGTHTPKTWNLTFGFPLDHNDCSTLQMLNKPKTHTKKALISTLFDLDVSKMWTTCFLYFGSQPQDAVALLTCLWRCCCCRSPSPQQERCAAACSCWCPVALAGKPWGWRSGWPGWTRCSLHSSPAPAASLCSGWAKNVAVLPPGPWLFAPHLYPLQALRPHPGEVKVNLLVTLGRNALMPVFFAGHRLSTCRMAETIDKNFIWFANVIQVDCVSQKKVTPVLWVLNRGLKKIPMNSHKVLNSNYSFALSYL